MLRQRRFVLVITAAVALGVVIVAWLQLAPVALGGRASYVIISGSSMNPSITEGDLVVVRTGGTHHVGDVVAYDNRLLGATVLHRIVEARDGHFVLKGDSNSWLDEYQPSVDDLRGSPWLHISGAGNYLRWLASPLHAGLILSVAGMFSFGGLFSIHKRRHRASGSRERGRPQGSGGQNQAPSSLAELALAGFLVAAIPLGLVSVLAFTRPTTEASFRRVDYSHLAEFSYGADVGHGPIYDDTRLATGEPIFRNAVRTVNVDFTYRFSAEAPHAVSGSGTLKLQLSDKTGWKRTFNLQPKTAFTGDTISLSGSFDLSTIDKVVEDFETLTGLSRDVYTLTIVPEIEVGGTLAGQECCKAFAPGPRLTFLRSPLQLVPSADGIQPAVSSDYLKGTGSGEVRVGHVEPNRLSLLGLGTSVGRARVTGPAGLALVLIGAAILGYWLSRGAPLDEAAGIERTYGHLIVSAETTSALPARRIKLGSFKSLTQMAERLETVVLHFEQSSAHTYVVYEGDTAFTFELPSAETQSEPGRFDVKVIAA